MSKAAGGKREICAGGCVSGGRKRKTEKSRLLYFQSKRDFSVF
jgi:hypothetical protein